MKLPALLLLLGAAFGRVFAADALAERVVILANSRQPESVRLAQFYADKREIPRANIIALPLPEDENVSWREFIDQVYQPVQDALLERGWLHGTTTTLVDSLGRKRYSFTGNRIAYLVTCRGVPLRVYNDPTLLDEKKRASTPPHAFTNEASVDSELSLLAQSGYEMTGMLPNPLAGNERPSIFDEELVVKVSRLDGPSWDQARYLVTAALEAEKVGLIGRAYVDVGGPHRDGDVWLEDAARQLTALGYDTAVNPAGSMFGAESRFDAPALYFGWYTNDLNGPFKIPDFRFPVGAIALHIHSFSAHTLRSDVSGWTGPFIARGVTATVGNVFEPFLQFTHRPHLLLKALAQGRTWGDAVYFSLPSLSWKCVAIGDPLYRPFKVTFEAQEANRAKLRFSQAPYVTLRRVNLLLQQKQESEALALLRSSLRERPDFAVSIALAKLLVAQGKPKEAVDTLAFLALMPSIRPVDWPVMREVAELLASQDARPVALKIYRMLANTKPPSKEALKVLLTEARRLADQTNDMKLSLEFARQLHDVDPPPPPPLPAVDAGKK